eukprot:748927-Hanusia_phi.AAC.1
MRIVSLLPERSDDSPARFAPLLSSVDPFLMARAQIEQLMIESMHSRRFTMDHKLVCKTPCKLNPVVQVE